MKSSPAGTSWSKSQMKLCWVFWVLSILYGDVCLNFRIFIDRTRKVIGYLRSAADSWSRTMSATPSSPALLGHIKISSNNNWIKHTCRSPSRGRPCSPTAPEVPYSVLNPNHIWTKWTGFTYKLQHKVWLYSWTGLKTSKARENADEKKQEWVASIPSRLSDDPGREESRLLLCKTPPIDAERKQLSPNSCAPSIPLSLSVGHTKNLTIDAFFSAFFIHPGFRCGLLYWGHFAIQAYFQSLHSFCIWIL